MKNNLFYTYYDQIFEKKKYTEETKLIFNLSRKYGIPNPKKILEIGSGTGNHTRELAQKADQVIGIDTDPVMCKIAQQKLKNLKNCEIKHIPIEKLSQKNFDLAIALFNVVTYIPDQVTLESFFKHTFTNLAPRGLFIFDLWNGLAAITQPPQPKKWHVRNGDEDISVRLLPKTNLWQQKTRLTYKITAQKNGKKITDSFSFSQTLWTPLQIETAVQKAEFRIISCFPLFNPTKKATSKDWKIMYCVQKN